MKIIADRNLYGILLRDFDWYAYDEDRLDGAPDAPITMQRQGHGATREEAIAELAAQAFEDYTDAQLTAGEVNALQSGDTTTLTFVALVRELEVA